MFAMLSLSAIGAVVAAYGRGGALGAAHHDGDVIAGIWSDSDEWRSVESNGLRILCPSHNTALPRLKIVLYVLHVAITSIIIFITDISGHTIHIIKQAAHYRVTLMK